ncbi:hypothetical protein D3C78_1222090 [compost metagenome]
MASFMASRRRVIWPRVLDRRWTSRVLWVWGTTAPGMPASMYRAAWDRLLRSSLRRRAASQAISAASMAAAIPPARALDTTPLAAAKAVCVGWRATTYQPRSVARLRAGRWVTAVRKGASASFHGARAARPGAFMLSVAPAVGISVTGRR